MATFNQLTQQQYINLETFCKSGVGVRTPVWFVQDGNSVFVCTIANSGKVKRIRNNGQVNIAPCKVAAWRKLKYRSVMVRWGVLGTAQIAKVCVIPAIMKSKNGVLQAVASRDLAKAQALVAKHRQGVAYEGYAEVLDISRCPINCTKSGRSEPWEQGSMSWWRNRLR